MSGPMSYYGCGLLDAAGGLIDPATLSPTLFVDPKDTASLWKETSRTNNATADGDVVDYVDDKGASGNDLSQASSGILLKIAGGLNWLESSPTGDKLVGPAMSALATVSDYTIVAAVRASSLATNSANPWFNEALWGDSAGFLCTYFRSSGNIGAYNGVPGNTNVMDGYTDGTDIVVTQRHTGGTLYLQVNNNTEVSVASGDTSTSWGTFRLLNQFTDVYAPTGRCYGFFMKNAQLTAQELSDVKDFMASRAGITI